MASPRQLPRKLCQPSRRIDRRRRSDRRRWARRRNSLQAMPARLQRNRRSLATGTSRSGPRTSGPQPLPAPFRSRLPRPGRDRSGLCRPSRRRSRARCRRKTRRAGRPIFAAPAPMPPCAGRRRHRHDRPRRCRAALAVLYRWVEPPISALMVGRSLAGTEIERTWVPLARISPHLMRAVILSEDGGSPPPRGGLDRHRGGHRRPRPRRQHHHRRQVVEQPVPRPSRSYVRKAIEIGLAYLVEALWPKRRILEYSISTSRSGATACSAPRRRRRRISARRGPADGPGGGAPGGGPAEPDRAHRRASERRRRRRGWPRGSR